MNRRQKLFHFFSNRVALNVYFWLFMFLTMFMNHVGAHTPYNYPVGWYVLFIAITTILLAVVLYINNLWLVPHYLVPRRYGRYFLVLLAFTYIAGFGYAVLFETLDIYFPKIDTTDVAIFSALRVNVNSPLRTFFEATSWVISIAAVLFVFTIAWYMHDYGRQRRISEEAQRKQVESELNFLKSQINPHFLFNTLNNLYTLTLKKSDAAPEVVSKLSSILRYLLYESNTEQVSFAKEKEIMEAYISLELLRLSNKDNLHFTIKADNTYNMPPLLWVPVLENVFKHGTRFISNGYHIDYHFQVSDGNLLIYSKNTFKQDTGNKLEGVGGIGLSNLQKRLALLYPNRHSVTTRTEDNYYITEIKIALA